MSVAIKPVLAQHTIVSTNPSRNYEVLGDVEISSPEEVQAKVQAAKDAFPAWSALTVKERLVYAQNLRDLYIKNKQKMAELMSQEMGMPINQTLFTVDRALGYINWSIDNAETSLAPKVSYETETEINQVHFMPYGVIAAISPWNFPASNFIWAVFQALIAGNTIVFKNSEEVQLFGVMIEELMDEAEFPEGVFNVIYGAAEAAQSLIACDIDYINFTGSTRVGQILAKQAGEKMIPCVLELGGSDPAVFFEDADLEKALPAIYLGRFGNCGQICCSSKRLIVHESRFDEVVSAFKDVVIGKKVGDAMNEDTDIGPLAAQRQLNLLKEQVQDAVEKGATIVCGGKEPDGLSGAYFEPTIITDVTPDMRVWNEEVFGPVLPIVKFSTYEQAIEQANDTEYGLGATIFTEDKDLVARATIDIKSGMIKVNQTAYSRPENPFGGVKHSGMGRENGTYGFEDVTQIKVIATEK